MSKRSDRVSLEEDEHTRDGSREMAADGCIHYKTKKLTHSLISFGSLGSSRSWFIKYAPRFARCRDLENIRVKGRVEGGMLDREATEKAVLVKENYELRNQLERMRVALRNVNKNIYGEKASEYCMKMAHAEVKWSGSNQITKKRLQTKAKSNIKKAWRCK